MRRMAVAAVAAAVALAGCARTGAGPEASSAARETIEYTTGPCFGRCPAFRIEIAGDGRGTFTGIRDTVVTGQAQFTATREQYAAFKRALAPWRPQGERAVAPGQPGCEQVATDLPSVEIVWQDRDARTSRLDFYYGCDMEKNEAMAEALGNAPDLLPLGVLIGERP